MAGIRRMVDAEATSGKSLLAISATSAILILMVVSIVPIHTKLLTSPLIEGVYVHPNEIGGFTGTILELKDGEFRYWFCSDVGRDDTPYPQKGTYAVDDGVLKLSNGRRWYIGNAGELALLWRSDALAVWQESNRVYDYGILVRIEHDVPELIWQIESPSINVVNQALGRPSSVWRDPFIYGAR